MFGNLTESIVVCFVTVCRDISLRHKLEVINEVLYEDLKFQDRFQDYYSTDNRLVSLLFSTPWLDVHFCHNLSHIHPAPFLGSESLDVSVTAGTPINKQDQQ